MASIQVAAFRALHGGQALLILPNAWDAASAALFRSIGAKAIATTSAALAWSRGYPDGSALPRAELFAAVAAVRRATGDTPLSVDIEDGYTDDPVVVAALVAELSQLGVAGINIEDAMRPADVLCAKIEAIRLTSSDIFINARTDGYLRGATGPAALEDATLRAARYASAGADGLFVPLLCEPDDIRAVAAATHLPLNLLVTEGLPNAAELWGLGARRLSAGSAIASSVYGVARSLATSLMNDGNSDAILLPDAVGYGEMNALFEGP
jgi:2-methylisocitrate lyase-like PEP mutase family enzyme